MNEELEEIEFDLCNFATAIEAAAVDLRQRIARRKKVDMPTTAISEDRFLNLKGEQSKGNKIGDYEVVYRNQNKPEEFDHCYGVLKANSATISNSFSGKSWKYRFWLYEKNTDRIYRKLKTPKEESGTTTTPAPVAGEKKAVEDAKVLFSSDLCDMLSFEEIKDFIVIKPRQFLGSENFAKIVAIVRDGGGEYISAGKESHFRIPRKA